MGGAAPPLSASCDFDNEPADPYYWDPDCVNGGLGCMADGVNAQCRDCAERPFENVTCPEHVAPPENQCSWPQQGTPSVPHYWDESCQMGMLGRRSARAVPLLWRGGVRVDQLPERHLNRWRAQVARGIRVRHPDKLSTSKTGVRVAA